MIHWCLCVGRYIPPDEPIDLLNVAFENPRKLRAEKEGNFGGVPKRVRKSDVNRKAPKTVVEKEPYLVPDRVTGLTEVEELRRTCPGRVWNFVSNFFFTHLDFVTDNLVRLK